MSSVEQEHRILGGYKAALHNPHVSDGAKEHAVKVLEAHGAAVPPDIDSVHIHSAHGPPGNYHHEHHDHANTDHDHKHETRGAHEQQVKAEHERHVVAGLKATLSNPRTSQEAKEHAVEKLKNHGEKV